MGPRKRDIQVLTGLINRLTDSGSQEDGGGHGT